MTDSRPPDRTEHIAERVQRALESWRLAPVAPDGLARSRRKPPRTSTRDDKVADAQRLAEALAAAGVVPRQLDTNYGAVQAIASEILHPLPRRGRLSPTANNVVEGPSMMRRRVFGTSRGAVLVRLVVWLTSLLRYFLGNLGDAIRRRNTIERRAVRMRLMFERMGGTAVKIGQQMAMRIDLVPYAYGYELARLLDNVPAFPVADAIVAIERVTGRPLAATFASFDPHPIGSASVSCVFQGRLLTGEHVAVKVRRPGIEKMFAADCRALEWVLALLEFLTILRPGFSTNVITEFRNMVLEELDFVKEARYTELFGRRLRKAKLRFVSAPHVYYAVSGEDVLVTEFVDGIWLNEIIAAIEQRDEKMLQLFESLGIDPELIARRLLQTSQFGIFESMLFHADPHPANILVRPDSKLVLIDFGSCGTYTMKERHVWRQLAWSHHTEDVGQMVQAALAVLEPLPPIDVDEFSKRLEQVFWQDLYAFKSKHAEWWERTSAKIWISFLELAREYQIPMNLNTLRMIRSTLLYETVAARLFHRINAYREHHKYNLKAGRRARKRLRREARKTIRQGGDERLYLRIEQLRAMGNRSLYLFQRFLDAPPFRFGALIGKAVYAASEVTRAVLTLSATTLVMATTVELYGWLRPGDGTFEIVRGIRVVVSHALWHAFAVIALALMLRRMVYRFLDREQP